MDMARHHLECVESSDASTKDGARTHIYSVMRCSRCKAANRIDASTKFCDQCGHRLHGRGKRTKKLDTTTRKVAPIDGGDGGWFWGSDTATSLPLLSEQRHSSSQDEHPTVIHESADSNHAMNPITAKMSSSPSQALVPLIKAHTANAALRERRHEPESPLRRARSSVGLLPTLPSMHGASNPRQATPLHTVGADTPPEKTCIQRFDSPKPSNPCGILWGPVLDEAIAEFESKRIILSAEIDSDERCISVLAHQLQVEEAARSKYVVASGASHLRFKLSDLEKRVCMNREKLVMVRARLASLCSQQDREARGSEEELPERDEQRRIPPGGATSNQDEALEEGNTTEGTQPPAKLKKIKNMPRKAMRSEPEDDSRDDATSCMETAAVRIQKRFRVLRARRMFAEMVKRAYQRVYDADTKQYFYYNSRTQQSQWEVPPALAKAQDISKRSQARTPSTRSLDAAAARIQSLYRRRAARAAMRQMLLQVYEKVYDAESNSYYYYCSKTKTSTWEKPKLLREEEISAHATAASSIPGNEAVDQAPTRVAAACRIQTIYRNRATRLFIRDLAHGRIERHFDADVRAWYYFNTRTQQSFWEQARHAKLAEAIPRRR